MKHKDRHDKVHTHAISQAWQKVAARLRVKAQLNARAEAHCRKGLLTSAMAHWRVLQLRRNIQTMWNRVGGFFLIPSVT